VSIPIRFTERAVFKTVLRAAAVHSPNMYSNIAIIQRSATQAIQTQGKI